MKRITKLTRFHCGCVYRSGPERAYTCPVHQEVVTGMEEILSDPGLPVKINRLARNPHVSGLEDTLQNWPGRSLTSVLMVRGDGFEDQIESEAGLCDACYIETNSLNPSGVVECGCENPERQYRWCGDASGLHAFHRMHVRKDYGKLAEPGEATARFDQDIFACGKAGKASEGWAEALDEERAKLKAQVKRVIAEIEASGLDHWKKRPGNLMWLRRREGPSFVREVTWLVCARILAAPETQLETKANGVGRK